VPKLDLTFHQILLRFKCKNDTQFVASVLPPYLMIEKVSLLKNSNALANDIYDYDIYYYNLHKLFNEYNLDEKSLVSFGMDYTNNKELCAF
jgi:hypothetical protein